ncbi:MAG: aryl-alcohol dehydrogenase-like predicted oxidoreductase [Verrucomicrobiales bacterium]|jgi:aryl-alcohol dehydrogenase-like predicted oxidoreductase
MVLGAWGNTDVQVCKRIIHAALDAGINLVDTADMYGDGENETLVGEALRRRRDEVVLCTKFHHPVGGDPDATRRGNSRRWIVTAVEDSLRRLGVDHIDLYQAHRPDPTVPIEETVDALSELVNAGKIRAWGTSTFPAEDLVEAHWAGERSGATGPHTEQSPYSILCRSVERDVLPVCQRYGAGVLTWSPLSGGWLTGKYCREDPAPAGSRAETNPDHFDVGNEAKFDAVEALQRIADQAGLSLTQMALAWNGEHPAISSTLIGPRTEEQLRELVDASDVRLSDDVLNAIDHVVPPGLTINAADTDWVPPGLAVDARRRR